MAAATEALHDALTASTIDKNLTTCDEPHPEAQGPLQKGGILHSARQSNRALVEGYGMAQGCVGYLLSVGVDGYRRCPASALAFGHRGESLDGVRRLSVSDNQPGR